MMKKFCCQSSVPLLAFVFVFILSQYGCQSTISCFTCSSRNGSDKSCEDPFRPEEGSYVERCKVPKRGHKEGVFPANFCLKLYGTSHVTNEKLVVRKCILATMDSQCGNFKIESELLRGCILTCDIDGCNSGNSLSISPPFILIALLILLASTFNISQNQNRQSATSNRNLNLPSNSSSIIWKKLNRTVFTQSLSQVESRRDDDDNNTLTTTTKDQIMPIQDKLEI